MLKFSTSRKLSKRKSYDYWNSHGGLSQQGYSISDAFDELNQPPPAGDGKVHRVQYFQRARFEEHTENAPPYDVLLGLLGSEQYQAKYADSPPAFISDPFGEQLIPSVQFISTEIIPPGNGVSVMVQTQAGVSCSIGFTVLSGVITDVEGLDTKTADSSGQITWSLLISSNTDRWAGQLDVFCNNGAGARTSV